MVHVISRLEIPNAIHFDNGTSFTSRVTELLTAALGINWTCHISYNPQNLEQIGPLRETCEITSDQTTWIDALLQVILSIRAMANSGTGLAHHEVLMDRPFPLGADEQDSSK